MAKILHIEDDPANRLLVRKLLTSAGFEVVEAADGLDGVKKAMDERPDLVLVDLAIPGLDGYEVTLRLRAEPKLRGTPIVAITAEGDRETSLAVGCDGFVQKPIDARSFADKLRGYLDGWKETTSPDATGQRLRLQSQRIVAHLEAKVAEISKANQRLLELDQAKKEFYRNISHELATPMTPIVGYLKLLVDGELGELSTPQEKALRAMADCVHRLRRLIDNLLDVTALETGRMRFAQREYDLAEIVRLATARQPAFDGRIHLVADLPRRGSLRGFGDVERIGRAVDQLLDNATKFTPQGGTVGVRARRLPSGHLEVCIADTGPGIPAEKTLRLFEPFYQVDGSPTRSHGGTGVGLSIVRGVALGHGGDVHVSSPANEEIVGVRFGGAAFYFVLPDRMSPKSEPPSRPL
jgi:signal transduction histidine kinase